MSFALLYVVLSTTFSWLGSTILTYLGRLKIDKELPVFCLAKTDSGNTVIIKKADKKLNKIFKKDISIKINLFLLRVLGENIIINQNLNKTILTIPYFSRNLNKDMIHYIV